MQNPRRPRIVLFVVCSWVLFWGLTSCSDEEKATQSECLAWWRQAGDERREATREAIVPACGGDDDCALAYYGLDCYEDCSELSAVARSSIPALAAEVQSINERVCGTFQRRGCLPFVPPPCGDLGTPVARCERGRCTLEWLRDDF